MRPGLRILSWNILHGGGPKRIPEITLAILAREPDVVVLTEFRASRGGQLRAMLADAGLEHQLTSVAREGGNAVLMASRQRLEVVEDGPEADGGRFLHAVVGEGAARLDLVGVHVPDRVEGGRKARFWRHLVSMAPVWGAGACVLVGDLNTARRGIDTSRNDFGVTSCADLMGVFSSHGFKDAWLRAHPGQREATWRLPRGILERVEGGRGWSGAAVGGAASGSRIDAAYVSAALADRIGEVWHDHGPRESGVSDHSLLVLDLIEGVGWGCGGGGGGSEAAEIGPKSGADQK
jgi:exonuclease III